MSFKNNRKFRKPFAKISFNSFGDALKNAIMYDDLKKLAWRESGVYFFAVNGLAKESYIETCFTNRHLWNKFEPSDLGDQIGYEFVGASCRYWREKEGPQADRSFITDIGINPNKRHNKHLVFTNKNMADAYLKYMKNSVSEQEARTAFLDSLSSMYGAFDYDDDYNDYEEQDYHYAMY